MAGDVIPLRLLTLLQRLIKLSHRARPRHDARPGREGQEYRNRQGIGMITLSLGIRSALLTSHAVPPTSQAPLQYAC